MTTNPDLRAAVAHIKRITPKDEPFGMRELFTSEIPHIATILNAVASGDLVPRAEAAEAKLARMEAERDRLHSELANMRQDYYRVRERLAEYDRAALQGEV